jgi:hypothetical protein
LSDVEAPTVSKKIGEVVSLTRPPAALHAQKDSWYSFLLEVESIPGPSMAERINPMASSGIEPCNIVSQPTTLQRAQTIEEIL